MSSPTSAEETEGMMRVTILIGSTLQLSSGTILLAALLVFRRIFFPMFTGDTSWAHILYTMLLVYGLINIPAGALGIVGCIDDSDAPSRRARATKARLALHKLLLEVLSLVYILAYVGLYGFYLCLSFDVSARSLALNTLCLLPWVLMQAVWLGACAKFRAQSLLQCDGYEHLPGSHDHICTPGTQAVPVHALTTGSDRRVSAAANTATTWFPPLKESNTPPDAPFGQTFGAAPSQQQTLPAGVDARPHPPRKSSDNHVLGSSYGSTTSAASMQTLMANAPMLTGGGGPTHQGGGQLAKVGEGNEAPDDMLEAQVSSLSGGIRDVNPKPTKGTLGSYLDHVLSLAGLSRSAQPDVNPSGAGGSSPTFYIPVDTRRGSEPSTPNNFSADGDVSRVFAWSPTRSQKSTADSVPSFSHNISPTNAETAAPPPPSSNTMLFNLYNSLTSRSSSSTADSRPGQPPPPPPPAGPPQPLHSSFTDGPLPSTAPPAAGQPATAPTPQAAAPQAAASAARDARQGASKSRGSVASVGASDAAVSQPSQANGSRKMNWLGVADESAAASRYGNMASWSGETASQALQHGLHAGDGNSSQGSEDGDPQYAQADADHTPFAPHRTSSEGDPEPRPSSAAPTGAPQPKLSASLLGVFNMMMWGTGGNTNAGAPQPAQAGGALPNGGERKEVADDSESFVTAHDTIRTSSSSGTLSSIR